MLSRYSVTSSRADIKAEKIGYHPARIARAEAPALLGHLVRLEQEDA